MAEDGTKPFAEPDARNTIEKVRGFGGQKAGMTSILKYPLNVGNTEVPNYIMFFPLIRSNSTMGQAMSPPDIKAGTVERPPAASKSENAVPTAAVAGGLTGVGLALTRIGGKVASKTSVGRVASAGVLLTTAAIKAGAKILGFGAAGAVVAAAATAVAGDESTTIFSKEAIVLQVQDNPKYGYSATWETSDLGAILGSMASGQADFSNLGDDVAIIARQAAGLAKNLGGGAISTLMDAKTKRVPNPYKEQLFRSVGFREFEFNYRFAPESQAEYDSVRRIIQKFSFHMHPEQDKSGFFFVYPSEFLIQVYHGKDINPHVKQMSNCALTNMSIEYGSTGGFTTFKGGIPTEINIRLKFTELELLTSKRISQGF